MSVTEIRPYFNNKLNTLGFKEWADGYNTENIPATIIDRRYHVLLGSGSGVRLNQRDQEINYFVTLNIFFKGFREPQSSVTEALTQAELIMLECVKSTNRTSGTNIKNVEFLSMEAIPYQSTNDNITKLVMEFSCFLVFNTN